MSCTRLVICLMLLTVSCTVALADVVTDWNEITLNTIKTADLPPTYSSRLLASVHIAIFDALNGIRPTYQPFYVKSRANYSSTDEEASVIAAAYTVLATQVPTQNAMLYQERQAALNLIPDSRAKQNGISWGNYVGRAVAYIRSFDGWNADHHFEPTYEPGYWRPTPPKYTSAAAYGWVYLQPFAVPDLEAFLAGPPPDLMSRAYANAVNEVKRLGAKNSAVRTADQTETALFWADDQDTISPPGRWNKVAQAAIESYGGSLVDNARLFAILNVAMADGCIAAWKCKYQYQLWRPITAIREADSLGNSWVVQNPKWTPLINTPPHPECVSGHSTFAGAAAEVLAWFCGTDDFAFDLHSDVTGTTRSYSSFTEAAQEDGRSRIYGGIHFQFSNIRGQSMGRQIAKYVYENVMLPL